MIGFSDFCSYDKLLDKYVLTLYNTDDKNNIEQAEKCEFVIDKITMNVVSKKCHNNFSNIISLNDLTKLINACSLFDVSAEYNYHIVFKLTNSNFTILSQRQLDDIIVMPDKNSLHYMYKMYLNLNLKYEFSYNNALYNSIVCSHINEFAVALGLKAMRLCEYTPGGIFLTLNNCIIDSKNINDLQNMFDVSNKIVKQIKKHTTKFKINVKPVFNQDLCQNEYNCNNELINYHIKAASIVAGTAVDELQKDEKISSCKLINYLINTFMDLYDNEYNMYLQSAFNLYRNKLIQKPEDAIYLSNYQVLNLMRHEKYKSQMQIKILETRRAANICKKVKYSYIFDILGKNII